MGVAIVHRLGFDPRGEGSIADCVHANVAAWNERLKLRRAVPQKIEARELIGAEAADDRADAAGRLVDHIAVLGVESAGRGGVAGDERRWHAQAHAADDERLIRLGVVGEPPSDAVDDRAFEVLEERHQAQVALGPERRRVGGVEAGQLRAIVGSEEPDVNAADRVEIEAPIRGGDPSLRAAVRPPPGDAVVLGEAGEVEQAVGIAAVLQPGTNQLRHAISKATADQDHDSTARAAWVTALSPVSSATRARRCRARVGQGEVLEPGQRVDQHDGEAAADGGEGNLDEGEMRGCGEARQRPFEGDRLGRRRVIPDHRVADDAGERRGAVRLGEADRRPSLQGGEALPCGVVGEEVARGFCQRSVDGAG